MTATMPMTGNVARRRLRMKRRIVQGDPAAILACYFFSMFQKTGAGPLRMPVTLLRAAIGLVYMPVG